MPGDLRFLAVKREPNEETTQLWMPEHAIGVSITKFNLALATESCHALTSLSFLLRPF